MMKRTLVSWFVLSMMALSMEAQSYTMDWKVIAGGGGQSAGGDYTLAGTIGQPDAGALLSGGPYTLQGGFWAGLAVITGPDIPRLFIQVSDSEVTVSWAPESPGFVLEMTDDLGTASWSAAPLGNPVQVPTTDQAKFYRLHKD